MYYTDRSINTNNWTFELGNSGDSTPTFVIVGFQAGNKIDSQPHNSTFDRLHVSNAVCKIASEKYHDDGIECDYDRDKYDRAYDEIETIYTLHAETNPLNSFISLQNSEHIIRLRV